MRALLKLLRFIWDAFGFDFQDVRDLWKWVAGLGLGSVAYAYATRSFEWFRTLPMVTQVFAAIALALAIVIVLSLVWPRKGRKLASAEPPRDLIAEGRERAAREQMRRHIQQIVQKHVLPANETADKALRTIVGQLPPDDFRVVNELIRAYTLLLADAYEGMGRLNVAANRSLQDAPEDSKPSVAELLDLLIETATRYFQLCDIIDGVRVLPPVLLRPNDAIGDWRDSRDKLKQELEHASHVEGLGALRRLAGHFSPDRVGPNSPRVVPKRYGHLTTRPDKSLEEGLFVENLGGPARSVVVQPIKLGHRTVKFTGPEVSQLKHEDGDRFFEVGVEGPPHHTSLDLFPCFREWLSPLM